MLLDNSSNSKMGTASTLFCPDCGSTDVIWRGECRLPGYLQTLPEVEQRLVSTAQASLYSCRHCGLGFRSPALDADALQSLYASMPTERWQYSTHNTAWRLAHKWLRQNFSICEAREILDVGAFDGAFMKTLPEGWKRSAIEPAIAAQAELKRNGITVIANQIQEPTPDYRGRFDVVTMFDVFEHLPTAKKSLAQVIDYLRPGGHLLLSTGNCEHWSWQVLGGDQWYCSTVQHLRFASVRYMEAAVRECGARLIVTRKHAHQVASWRERLSQAYETCSFAAFRRPVWWSPVFKCISMLPACNYVRHKTMGPYTPALKDHLFFVIEKCH